MKASSLIGRKIVHATDADLSGEVRDILFDLDLSRAVYLLADVTTAEGTSPLMFHPDVLGQRDGDRLEASNHSDSMQETLQGPDTTASVALDPSDLPSTLIGPFGNTISPSMIAALFNATWGGQQTGSELQEGSGVWLSELQGHPVRAHVADVGHVDAVILDEDFTTVTAIEIETGNAEKMLTAPKGLDVHHTSDGALSISLRQV